MSRRGQRRGVGVLVAGFAWLVAGCAGRVVDTSGAGAGAVAVAAVDDPADVSVDSGAAVGDDGAICGCAPRPAGLIAWWRGEGDARDAAGDHHGALTDGAHYGPGVVGQAFVFARASSFAGPTNGFPLGNAARTLELWARLDEITWQESFLAGYVRLSTAYQSRTADAIGLV